MSCIFGTKAREGMLAAAEDLQTFAKATLQFSPDGTAVLMNGRIGMGFQPFHTHERSASDVQPRTDELGNMITFDGRLDNYSELCSLLQISERNPPDFARCAHCVCAVGRGMSL